MLATFAIAIAIGEKWRKRNRSHGAWRSLTWHHSCSIAVSQCCWWLFWLHFLYKLFCCYPSNCCGFQISMNGVYSRPDLKWSGKHDIHLLTGFFYRTYWHFRQGSCSLVELFHRSSTSLTAGIIDIVPLKSTLPYHYTSADDLTPVTELILHSGKSVRCTQQPSLPCSPQIHTFFLKYWAKSMTESNTIHESRHVFFLNFFFKKLHTETNNNLNSMQFQYVQNLGHRDPV